jgi:hypothetical protein
MKEVVYIMLMMMIVGHSYGQDKELQDKIRERFFTRWLYFRMEKTPLLSYDDIHDQYGRLRYPWEILLPEEFSNMHEMQIKILPWYSQESHHGLKLQGEDFFFIIEKGDGLTGIKWDYFTYEQVTPIDTLHINVYDSLFLYDNRFLAAHCLDGRIRFYSGNVLWDDLKEVINIPSLDCVAYIRGVQFGIQRIRELKPEWVSAITGQFPEYSGWEFVYAEEAPVLTYGQVLITAPTGKAKDCLEIIYYTDNPAVTGDEEDVYYEMKYKLPTDIKMITERRLEKRKLPAEETQRLRKSPLLNFFDRWKGYRIEVEEVDNNS